MSSTNNRIASAAPPNKRFTPSPRFNSSQDERTRLLNRTSPSAYRASPKPRGEVSRSPGPTRSPGRKKEDLKDIEEEEEINGGTFLAVIFLIYVVVALGNRLFQKLQTIPMYNYVVFLNLLTTFAYIPVCFAYIIPMILWGSAISKEQREIPKYKFFVMGFLDCISAAMQIFAVNFITNASILVLLQQSAIPISMAISKVSLKTQYTYIQVFGASVVCVGIVVVLLPQFTGGATADDNGHSQVLWCFINIVSCIPMTLSAVYKEKALQGQAIDVVYLNGWVAIFQFLLCIPLSIPSAMAMNLPLSDVPQNLVDGYHCFLGHSSVAEASLAGGPMPVDQCSTAPLYVSVYLVFNIAYNILVVVILKYGSANIMYLGSTALVPLTNAAFSLNWIPGHQPVRPTDVIGLIVIMAGIFFYRFVGTKEKVQPTKERRRALYMGLNATSEMLQPMIDQHIWIQMAQNENKIRRSPAQIRSSYMAKLGLPPSPQISMRLDRGGGRSPGALQRMDIMV